MKLKFDITAQEYTIIKAVLEQTLGSSCDVWVYGSRAKNRADFNSDLDLAVDCQDKIPAKILAGLHAGFNEAKLAFNVDVVDLNDVEPRFKQIITQQKVPFPLSGMVPKLRFPGFGGEWEEKPFGDFYEFKSTNAFSRDKLNCVAGQVRNIHYGDIHTKFKHRFELSYEDVPFINLDINLENISEDKFCKEGDLVIADASEDYTDIGKTIELINLNGEKVLAGLHTLLARLLSKKICIGFGAYMMKCESVRKQIKTIAQGTKVLGISPRRMEKIKLPVPSYAEQQKIAGFLTSVDTKIEQLGREKALWKQYKKGMMQKLFSREIRFRDAQGNDFPDWEEKRLGEVASFSKGKGISKDNISENGNLECIRYGQLYTDYAETIRKVKSRTNIPANELVLSEANDIIIPASGETQIDIAKASCVLAEGVALGGDINIIKTRHDGVFLSYYLNSEKRYDIARLSQGISVVHLYATQLKQLHLELPSIPEQQKIADFLSAIDRKIDHINAQLEQARTFKKGLLQQMFI